MHDDDSELITPAEVFRLLLRARYLERPALADEIVSIDWFGDRQLRRPLEGTVEAAEYSAACEALNAFYRHVERHEIRLRGIASNGNARDVDAIEQAVGDLDIWERALDCTDYGVGNFYRNLWAYKADVGRIINPPPPTGSTAGAPPTYDYEPIRGEAFRHFKKYGLPDRNGQPDWRTQANLERKLAEFCLNVVGKEPAKGTLQRFAARAIADWKAIAR